MPTGNYSVFWMTASGLVTYREELTSAYDTNRSGGTLFDFTSLFDCLSGNEVLGAMPSILCLRPVNSKLKRTFSNTYERIPCTQVSLPLNQPVPFFKATEISAPKISFEIEVSREEVSTDIIGTTLRIAKKIVEFTDAQVSDEELRVEIEKIDNLS